MQKTLSVYYNGLKINVICKDERLYDEQYNFLNKFFVFDKTEVKREINIYYSKNTNVIESVDSKIKEDFEHYIINPFGHQQFNVQERSRFTRYMSSNKNNLSIQHKNGSYIIVGNENENTKYAPYTTILELISRYNEENNCAIFHATAFALGRNGIMCTGESGSGKTTLLTKLLDFTDDIELLSNERVYMGNNSIYYFPIEILLSMGTVKNSVPLYNYFASHKISETYFKKSLEETLNNEKYPIKPNTFCKINNINCIPQSNLSLIVFPKINFENHNALNIRVFEEKEIVEQLTKCCFTPFDKESHREMWIDKGTLSTSQLESMSNELIFNVAKNIPCISVEYGKDTTGKQILTEINNTMKNMENMQHEK